MTDPTKYYGELVSSIQVYDLRHVARILARHIGETNSITLESLTKEASGKVDETEQRKTRKMIETLIEDYGFPVCSHSGKAGRWLAATQEEAIDAAKERESRAHKLLESAQKLRAAKLPAGLPKFASDLQRSLF